jgi:crotonobetainyl-CoA:carnitine CoA-transferase CaiB-like acyl-CoA transferase
LTSPPTGGALEGLLVADFSRVLAGPYMTMLLGDLGAEVIKVEGPEGDQTRDWGPPWSNGAATYYRGVNRNKRGMRLDLRDPDDVRTAHALIARADVVVENFLPGRMEGFGLSREQAATTNPGVIYCSISGFGTRGRGADMPGYDLLAQAASGLMSITGPSEGSGYKVGVAAVDILCGLHGAVGILAALANRARTGEGQHVEVDLMSSALSALANQSAAYLMADSVPTALGNAHPSVAPYEPIAAADGMVVVAVGSDVQFRRLATALRVPAVADDPRYKTNSLRVANRQALIAHMTEILGAMTRAEAITALTAQGVPCAAINDVAEAFELASDVGLEPTWEIAGERHVRAPFLLSATPPQAYRPSPAQGQDDAELRDWLDLER